MCIWRESLFSVGPKIMDHPIIPLVLWPSDTCSIMKCFKKTLKFSLRIGGISQMRTRQNLKVVPVSNSSSDVTQAGASELISGHSIASKQQWRRQSHHQPWPDSPYPFTRHLFNCFHLYMLVIMCFIFCILQPSSCLVYDGKCQPLVIYFKLNANQTKAGTLIPLNSNYFPMMHNLKKTDNKTEAHLHTRVQVCKSFVVSCPQTAKQGKLICDLLDFQSYGNIGHSNGGLFELTE